MTAVLDHTIAPVRDQDESGDFYTNVLGFKYDGRTGMNDVFAVIRLNDSSTLDLWRSDEIPGLSHHYGLALDRAHFVRFFQAIRDSGIPPLEASPEKRPAYATQAPALAPKAKLCRSISTTTTGISLRSSPTNRSR